MFWTQVQQWWAFMSTLWNVTFGINPPVVWQIDLENDTYFQTSNWLSTWTVVAEWVFDLTSSTWIKVTSQSISLNDCNWATLTNSSRISTAPNSIASWFWVVQTNSNSCIFTEDRYFDNNLKSFAGNYINQGNRATGQFSFVWWWYGANTASALSWFIWAWYANKVTNNYSAIVGWYSNESNQEFSFNWWWYLNRNTWWYMWAMIGGSSNKILAWSYSFIGEGSDNQSSSSYSFIGEGSWNTITGTADYWTILNGSNWVVTANYGYIYGGFNNRVAGQASSIIAWGQNIANGNYDSLSWYSLTTAAWSNGNVLGGYYSTLNGNFNAMFGYSHVASSSAINYNIVSGYNSTITNGAFGNAISGYQNQVSGERWVIGGNQNTYAWAYWAIFGNANTIWAGVYGTQISGSSNTVSGWWNSLVAGDGNTVAAGSLYTKFVWWYYNIIWANSHVVNVFGQQNQIGTWALLANAWATAMWLANNVSGQAAMAIGYNNTTLQSYAIAIGSSIINNVYDSVLIWGAATKVWFYNIPPVARQTLPAVATTAQITTALRNLWLIA